MHMQVRQQGSMQQHGKQTVVFKSKDTRPGMRVVRVAALARWMAVAELADLSLVWPCASCRPPMSVLASAGSSRS